MDNQKKGEQLNQFARFLFDEAANNFYLSLIIEIVAGLLAVGITLVSLPEEGGFAFALIGFGLLAYSYYLRLRFDDQYDTAETMRRQPVLSEALDWPISSVQFSDWKVRASKAALQRTKLEKRADDYYETKSDFGAKKLLEMTAESAFYTRCLYTKLRGILVTMLVFSMIAVAIVFSVLPLNLVSDQIALRIAYVIYLLLPIILSLDLLGWVFKLSRLSKSIKEVESDVERLLKEKRVDEKQAMRLVSEYNCQVSCGFPIHNILFRLWHDEIRELWENR